MVQSTLICDNFRCSSEQASRFPNPLGILGGAILGLGGQRGDQTRASSSDLAFLKARSGQGDFSSDAEPIFTVFTIAWHPQKCSFKVLSFEEPFAYSAG